MFEGCEGLISINISKIPTSKVINTNSMFYGCQSLILIDISNLNLEQVLEAELMFYDLPSLEYLSLNEGNYSSPIKEQLIEGLSNKDNLIICSQNKTDENFVYRCCNYNLESHSCEKATNYMIVYYESDFTYTNGFKKGSESGDNAIDNTDYEFREGIEFLIYDNNTIMPNETLIIKDCYKLEIHFSYPITNLISFFDKRKDSSEIISIDLSHFDWSKVTSTANMFYSCSKLKSVYFSDIDTSNLKNMSYMFEGCSTLRSVNLSSFDISSVIDLSGIFKSCSNLRVIDISGLDMKNDVETSEIFEMVSNLEYLNIRGIINLPTGFADYFKNMKLKVCQNTTIIEGNNIINDCCFFYEDDISCNQNYIILIT